LSSFVTSKSGIATGLLRGAGDIVGGFLGSASYGADELRDVVAGPAHDRALQKAIEEMKPLFVQCRKCGNWVCREVCWNAERGLCTACAPIAQREISSMQAQITVEQAEEKLRQQDLTSGLNLASKAVVVCPSCGAENEGGKFCQECGAPLLSQVECPRCGTRFRAGAKFCPECGAKAT
jgi:ribosomal protein L32